MIIPDKVLDQHVAVLGKTRSGKSSVMRGMVEHLLDEQKPVCIVDPKGDWWGIKLSKNGKNAGYPVVIFGGEHADVPINAHAGAHVAELFATGNRPCLIDLGGWMIGERTRFWIDFAGALFKLARGRRWLVVDEVHNFAPKGKIMDPDAGKALHWTNRLASEGLGRGLSMLFASQRPQKVHNDTLTSAETLIAMRVLHPSDRGAVSDWIKGCGDARGDLVLASLAQMARGEGWAWSPEIGFGPERVKFPMFKTYDSFRPQTAEDTASLKGWAEVDLDDVKAKLATVVKEAQANDPKALRKRVFELERELAKKEPPTIIKEGPVKIEKIEIPVVGKKAYAGILQTAKVLDKHYRNMRGIYNAYGEDLIRLEKKLDKLSEDIAGISKEPHTSAGAQSWVTMTKPFPIVAPPPVRVQVVTETGGVTGAQLRILDALAELAAIGISRPPRAQVMLFAGYTHPSSKGFANSLGALKTAGLIDYPDRGMICLTESGRARSATIMPAGSNGEVQKRIVALLGGSAGKVLQPLLENYPISVSRETLMLTAGYGHASSKGFANTLGRLRSLGLIDYPTARQVRATDLLFPIDG